MNTKKAWFLFTLLAIIVWLICGCETKQIADNKNNDAPEIVETTEANNTSVLPSQDNPENTSPHTQPTTTESAESAPTTAQVSEDLLYLSCNIFSLDGVDTSLNINAVQLDYVRNDIPFDIFRYNVVYGNEFYKVDAVYDLSYAYDGEYWILSNYSLISHNSRAIKSQVDQNKVIKNCERHFDSFKITGHDSSTDDNGVFTDVITFQGTIESNYFTEIFDCTYTYKFEDDYWREDWDITPRTIDFSLVEGTWKLEHYDEYITINIESIVQTQKDTIDIIYSYETSPWYDSGIWNGYFKSDCDGSSKPLTRMQKTCKLSLYPKDFCGGNDYGGVTYKHLDTFAFALPIQIGGWEAEWEDGYFTLVFDINEGFCIHRFKYLYKNPNYNKNSWEWRSDANETTVYFKKVIDWNSVQDATDKLKEMNP